MSKWQSEEQTLLHFCLLDLRDLQGNTRNISVAAESLLMKGHSHERNTDRKSGAGPVLNLECKRDTACQVQSDQTPWLPELEEHCSLQGSPKPYHISLFVALHCLGSWLSATPWWKFRFGSLLPYMLVGNTDPFTQGIHLGVISPISSRIPQKTQVLTLLCTIYT